MPVLTVALNVAEEAQWQEVADRAVARFGKIHIEVNLMAVVYGAKVMVPLIKQHGEGGWVVNVASMAGMAGVAYRGA